MPSTHCLGACILCKRHWLYLVSGASRTSALLPLHSFMLQLLSHRLLVTSTSKLATHVYNMADTYPRLGRKHSAQYIAWAIRCWFYARYAVYARFVRARRPRPAGRAHARARAIKSRDFRYRGPAGSSALLRAFRAFISGGRREPGGEAEVTPSPPPRPPPPRMHAMPPCIAHGLVLHTALESTVLVQYSLQSGHNY